MLTAAAFSLCLFVLGAELGTANTSEVEVDVLGPGQNGAKGIYWGIDEVPWYVVGAGQIGSPGATRTVFGLTIPAGQSDEVALAEENPPAIEAPAATANSTDVKPDPADGSSPLTTPVEPLSPELEALRDKVRKVLAIYAQRPVNARDHCPWEVFHWIIGYNVDAMIRADGPWGNETNAVGWLCFNHPCQGQNLLTTVGGRVTALNGVGLQGHDGQFLAILAQSRVMATYPLRVDGKPFTVADLVETEKLGCRDDIELTFKLMGLMRYLDSDAKWKNSSGEDWNIPRLIRREIANPIHGAACGGTHRLMGLSYAVRMRIKRGEPIDGEFRRAQQYVQDYGRYTLGMQNPDGSFSTAWFVGREDRQDTDRRLQTTGHILEWLVYSREDSDLRDPKIVKAVDYLAGIMTEGRQRDWRIGPLGHAIRGLSLYDRRVFQPTDPATPLVAEVPGKPVETGPAADTAAGSPPSDLPE